MITGFGASSAWTAQSLTDDEADLFFSRERGLGLSLLRLRIAPNGATWENIAAIRAHERGVAVWAAPWSPPGAWKTNGSDVNGGSLLVEHYQDWADRLAEFAKTKRDEGIPLVGISVQNEPDWVADWETCEWTPEQMVSFIRDYLEPTLEDRAPGTPIIAPEVANWNSLPEYADAILDDDQAAEAVSVIAVHSYGGKPFAYTRPHDAGLEFWETEVSYHQGTGIASALYTAAQIHEHLTLASVNAFHYWWLKSDDETSLMRSGVLTPPAYALGHFSKFVRPGYVRIETNPAVSDEDLLVSAYLGSDEGLLVVVAINTGDEEVSQGFRIDGVDPITVTPWLTSERVTLREQPRQLAQNPFSFELSARSITTLVLDIAAEPPATAGAPSTAEGGAAGAEPGDMTASTKTATSSASVTSGGGSGGRTEHTSNDVVSSSGGAGGDTTGSSEPPVDPRPGPYACLCAAPGGRTPRAPLWAMLLGFALAASRRLPRSRRHSR